MKQKHLHMARRKMCRVIDELYTLLLRSGGEAVDLHIRREAEGLRLLAEGVQPEVRNAALVEEFWELAGGDQYTSDSELALVGQMVDEASIQVGEKRVEIALYIRF